MAGAGIASAQAQASVAAAAANGAGTFAKEWEDYYRTDPTAAVKQGCRFCGSSTPWLCRSRARRLNKTYRTHPPTRPPPTPTPPHCRRSFRSAQGRGSGGGRKWFDSLFQLK